MPVSHDVMVQPCHNSVLGRHLALWTDKNDDHLNHGTLTMPRILTITGFISMHGPAKRQAQGLPHHSYSPTYRPSGKPKHLFPIWLMWPRKSSGN